MNSRPSMADTSTPDASSALPSRDALKLAAQYQSPSLAGSIWQLVSTFALFFGLVAAMCWSLSGPYIFTIAIGALAGAMLLRIFIIQHDCGHGSFFVSKKYNDLVGSFCSLFSLIPYYYWRRQHAIHHASNGNLDHRGHGDVDLLTVTEYQALPLIGKIRYRIYRNPFMFLGFGPFWFIFVTNRFAFDKTKCSKQEQFNVYATNAVIAAAFAAFGLGFGWVPFFKVLLPIVYFAALGGIWLFYIQHQYEHTYWEWDSEWDYITAAMQGSSFYQLPAILRWATGSIGYHHIHHLKPSIPNYLLQRCHEENPEFQRVVTITFWASLKAICLSLWDEERKRLISFREYARLYPKTA